MKAFGKVVGISLGLIAVLGAISFRPGIAEDSGSQSGKACKKCVSDIIKGCCDREQRTSQAISNLMDQLKSASASDDTAKMKAALESAKKSLSDMKADHDKSGDVLKKLHGRMESLKQQIKTVKREHEKAASLIEDEDMDDIIWAY